MTDEFAEMLDPVNPYLVPEPTIVSFSGGRTSGYLLYHIVRAFGGSLPTWVKVVFANTGKEHEATLEFVRDCSYHWDVEVTWVEFDLESEHQTRIVTFESAARNGRPLSDIIRSRPTQHLFNPVSRYCSVSSKARRIQKYAHKWLGWEKWYSATGLRADEPRRVDKGRARWGRDRQWPIFPLSDAGVTKQDVADFWNNQNFDLKLPNIGGVTPLGNCILCPLKSRSKLINILRKMPDEANWWIAQEDRMTEVVDRIPRRPRNPVWIPDDPEYPEVGQWIIPKPKPERRHRFFKDGTSYRDLLSQAAEAEFFDEPMDEGFDSPIDCICHD